MSCAKIGLPVPPGRWSGRVHSVFRNCLNVAVKNSKRMIVIHSFSDIILPGGYYTRVLDTGIFEPGMAVFGDEKTIRVGGWQMDIDEQCERADTFLQSHRKGSLDTAPYRIVLNQKRRELNLPQEVSTQVYRKLDRGMTDFFHALYEHDIDGVETAACQCVGLGFGLTPSGDDMLCGALAALRIYNEEKFAIASEAVRKAADRTNDISRSYLLWACDGYGSDLVRKTAESVSAGCDRSWAECLLQTGHSSGADILEGILRAAEYESMISAGAENHR